MAHINMHEIEITSSGLGAATAYTPIVNGYLVAFQYVKTDFTSGVDLAITTEETGVAVFTYENMNASDHCRMGMQEYNSSAAGATHWDTGSPVTAPWPIDNERLKIVITAAGAAKTGTIRLWIDGAA